MIKIITTGIIVEDNFGCPSILHGVEELLTTLYGNEYELINYQTTQFSAISISDLNFKTVKITARKKKILIDAIKDKLGFKSKNPKIRELLDNIKSADVVIDLYGICFCDNFVKDKYTFSKMTKRVLGEFWLLFLAKIYNVKTAKNTSSFGPMNNKINYKSANFACKYIFDVISAREQKSREMLIKNAKVKNEILISPDIANLMKYTDIQSTKERHVGISVSHQIIKQWRAQENYIDCMVKLCKHIKNNYAVPIVLIPNECQNSRYNDVDVSKDIKKVLNETGINVDILDVVNKSSTAVKNCIASCEIMIASRYHSCVASLSSGVPLLVLGWHYKYDELLHWYGQDKWILSEKECTIEKLISAFDLLWENRFKERILISSRFPAVRQAVIDTGKQIFSKKRVKQWIYKLL